MHHLLKLRLISTTSVMWYCEDTMFRGRGGCMGVLNTCVPHPRLMFTKQSILILAIPCQISILEGRDLGSREDNLQQIQTKKAEKVVYICCDICCDIFVVTFVVI